MDKHLENLKQKCIFGIKQLIENLKEIKASDELVAKITDLCNLIETQENHTIDFYLDVMTYIRQLKFDIARQIANDLYKTEIMEKPELKNLIKEEIKQLLKEVNYKLEINVIDLWKQLTKGLLHNTDIVPSKWIKNFKEILNNKTSDLKKVLDDDEFNAYKDIIKELEPGINIEELDDIWISLLNWGDKNNVFIRSKW